MELNIDAHWYSKKISQKSLQSPVQFQTSPKRWVNFVPQILLSDTIIDRKRQPSS